MRVFKLIDELKEQYKDDLIIRKNETMLLGPGKIPKARHMLFKGLTTELISEFLIIPYKNKFPSEYEEFLKYSNGASLFMIKIRRGKLEFAGCYLTILGLPRTQPFSRPMDMEEPFDIRIEDLARHEEIPNTWLKCGRYKTQSGFGNEADLFIDTVSGQVFSCRLKEKDIIESWEDLDDCLCDIIQRVRDWT